MSEELETNADKILAEAMRMSEKIEADIAVNPKKYRVLHFRTKFTAEDNKS